MTHHKHDEVHDGTHVHEDEAMAEVAHREHDRDVVLASGLEEIQKQVQGLFRWLLIGVAIIALGAIGATWYIFNLANKADATATQNRQLISQVDMLNRAHANQTYQECVQRNAQTKASRKELAKLVSAHKRDGSMNASKFWKAYLDKINARELPPCQKPKDAATENGDPVKTPTTTTVPRS